MAGRIGKELTECQKDVDTSGVSASVKPSEASSSRPTELVGTIRGPDGTPYEGGHFVLDIKIPPNYPFEPPKIQFVTKVWHPNVSSQTGVICLDILKDEWSPALTIKTALLSIQALLSAAEPTDPQDAQVAKMYMSDRADFDRTAKFWTKSYAQPPSADGTNPATVQKLVDMGFTSDAVKAALVSCAGDENAALEHLLLTS